jgi:hypothetical protein
MRYLIFFLLMLSCNKSQVVEDCPAPQQLELKTVAGFFVLDTDYRITNLDESINLSSENLTIGYSYGDGILWIESDEFNFHEWRDIEIAMVGFKTHGKYSVLEYTSKHSEIQLDEELNFWINEHQDAPIFFHLNLEI